MKGGRQSICSALYMAVISAIKSNPKIRSFYQRLPQKGKKAKVVIIAYIPKFLIILNAIFRNMRSFYVFVFSWFLDTLKPIILL